VRSLRLLFFAIGASLGTFYPFVVVSLEGRGLGAAEIGVVTAAAAVAFTVAVPVWGHLGDVTLGRVRGLQLSAILTCLVVVGYALPIGAAVAAGLIVAFSLFEAGFAPMSDALALATVPDRARDYARVRLLTSLGFAIVSIGCGFVFERTGYGAAAVPFAVAVAVIVFSAGRLRDAPRADLHAVVAGARAPDRSEPRQQRAFDRLGSVGAAFALQPRLPLVLLAICLAHVAILASYTFLPLRIVALGGGAFDVALSAGIAALFEVVGMLGAGVVAARVGLRGLFALAALLYAACLLTWVVLDQPLAIVATRVFTGLGFSGVAIASTLTLGSLLPAELQATGQALLQTVAFGLGAVIADLFGGLLYAAGGPGPTFALAAATAAASAALAWLVFPRRGAAMAFESMTILSTVPAAERELPFGG
jgi:PPP family 3-phenylpropionic acid transporter